MTFSSAHAAVRADDGLCGLHDRYVAADAYCMSHAPRSVEGIATAQP